MTDILFTHFIRGHLNIAVLLLEHNALIDAINYKEYTPLHYAAREGHGEVCEVYVEYILFKLLYGVLSVLKFLKLLTSSKTYNKSGMYVCMYVHHTYTYTSYINTFIQTLYTYLMYMQYMPYIL